jgi:hypothetical protein
MIQIAILFFYIDTGNTLINLCKMKRFIQNLKKADVFFLIIIGLMFLSMPCVVLSSIVSDHFYQIGSFLYVFGRFGLGLSIVGLGIIEFLYPKEVAKWLLFGDKLGFVTRLAGLGTIAVGICLIFNVL